MARITDRQESIDRTQDSSSYSLSYEEVKQQFDQLNPAPINTACSAWARAASKLGTIANRLQAEAGQPLATAWESDASPDAQQQLRTAQATARALADQCMQMAHATDYAYRYADWYKAHVPGQGLIRDTAITGNHDATAAQDHLLKLLGRYNEVIAFVIPPEVRAQLVESNPAGVDDFTRTGGGGAPGGAGGVPAVPGGGGSGVPGAGDLGGAPLSGVGAPAGGGGPQFADPGGVGSGLPGAGSPATGGVGAGGVGDPFGDPYAADSALAGSGGSGLGAGPGPAGGLGSGLGSGSPGAGGIGAGPGGPGAGLGGPAAGVGPAGIAGGPMGAGRSAGRGAGGGPGGAGRSGRVGTGPGAGGAGAAGRGGLAPLHGGGHGEDEQERERTTWLTEDEDDWGGETNAPPPVIGG
jgi:hypothetical protein